MWWNSSNGKIELNITKRQAAGASHPGDCDQDVMLLSQVPAIRRQLAKVDPEALRQELSEYGAWDDVELVNHVDNVQRLLWLACGDITEGNI